jgi:hypothetical protein
VVFEEVIFSSNIIKNHQVLKRRSIEKKEKRRKRKKEKSSKSLLK